MRHTGRAVNMTNLLDNNGKRVKRRAKVTDSQRKLRKDAPSSASCSIVSRLAICVKCECCYFSGTLRPRIGGRLNYEVHIDFVCPASLWGHAGRVRRAEADRSHEGRAEEDSRRACPGEGYSASPRRLPGCARRPLGSAVGGDAAAGRDCEGIPGAWEVSRAV